MPYGVWWVSRCGRSSATPSLSFWPACRTSAKTITRQPVSTGRAWPPAFGAQPGLGLSHGAAGICWALFELAAATGDDRALSVLRKAVDAPDAAQRDAAIRALAAWPNAAPLEDLIALARLQYEILEAAATIVRVGGLLVYATCSLEPEENEERMDAFLAEHPEYVLEAVEMPDPALLDARGRLVVRPWLFSVDGAFAARLRRA